MITNDTLRIIRQRRSVRSYKPEQIKDEELQAVLEAGLYAPNAGDQAWHFTAVQNRDLLQRIDQAAKEAAGLLNIGHLRALWDREGFNCTYGAPTLVIISADGQAPIPLDADCAAAAQNMLIAAESIGLGSCWIYLGILAFYSPQGPALIKELNIPEGYKPMDAVLLGYRNEPPAAAPERKPGLITIIR